MHKWAIRGRVLIWAWCLIQPQMVFSERAWHKENSYLEWSSHLGECPPLMTLGEYDPINKAMSCRKTWQENLKHTATGVKQDTEPRTAQHLEPRKPLRTCFKTSFLTGT